MDINTLLTTAVKDLTLQDLPYGYDALAPNISQEIMTLHHDKHHAGYLAKLQDGLQGKPESEKTLTELFSSLSTLEESVKNTVQNNGGGYINHAYFWNFMTPQSTEVPSDLEEIINNSFSSVDNFKQEFTNAASTLFGSGWAWLVKTPSGGLEIVKTANQISPLMTGEGTPVLGIDVWEHAYYLDYKNVRGDYINNWWNVVNWNTVLELTK